MNQEPKTKRRWFRFSLRTLFVFVTLASVGFGWLGYKVRQAQRQQDAVEAIRTSGGTTFYDYNINSDGHFDSQATPPGPAWLRGLLGEEFFAHVTCVHVGVPPITDAELAHFRALTRLETLVLNGTPITDSWLAHLQEHTQLESLCLANAPITDAGLIHLRQLTRLETLSLDHTPITDAGLMHLRGLTQLESLVLNGTQITDKGLAHLQGLTQLKFLYLQATQVSDKGCQELRKALPNLGVFR